MQSHLPLPLPGCPPHPFPLSVCSRCPELSATLAFAQRLPLPGLPFPAAQPCLAPAYPLAPILCCMALESLGAALSCHLRVPGRGSSAPQPVSLLPPGYNQILIVPVGATSILIEEAAASRNFLAVKNVHGEYYLNGHWTIEAARALPAASTILHYERGTEGDLAPERLYARGPISEPLVIELISQEPNPGVHYEYHLPLRHPGPGFSWSHGSWSDCSVECGGGHQSRLVFCTIDHEAYPDHMCQRQPRPADRRSCNLHPCPETKR
ncbi:hypothetical protein P7K49_018288 [Saguinus oedipus]|uniref:ADAMTS/ADAMTS-like Spacer 1 domain-containing protein n=1 Tax=Saguinus oedipus TaxID=9490 RepID=A0ABQ9V4Z1_SAGOE|nr:hypothetical protein P7K49_018288 [Saguinus oedipus]